jgi:hypothetical protein
MSYHISKVSRVPSYAVLINRDVISIFIDEPYWAVVSYILYEDILILSKIVKPTQNLIRSEACLLSTLWDQDLTYKKLKKDTNSFVNDLIRILSCLLHKNMKVVFQNILRVIFIINFFFSTVIKQKY